ncbi:MAG: MBL fold metallo-hydrolase [Candidatus Caldarchaeum sp.]|nr:MBL fold metallo-hydrolase [Candidatus Caldarchaeum sp.]MDW8359163.1 MBL fold metallo-hydrolase [Candidatus Caldarchaeum sp.]
MPVYLVDTRALGFEKTVACYLVKGKKTAIVDTGYSSSAETVVQAIKQLGVDRLDYIIPTHVHLDHAGAAWKLAEKFPDAVVLAHERAVKHLVDPSRLVASALELYGPEVMRMFGEVRGIEESRVHRVGDGETLSLGDVELVFIYTPGHAPHQMSVLISDGSLATADAVPAKYPDIPLIIPTTPPPSFDYSQYVQSLRKLGKTDAKTFLTPHYGPTQAGEEWVERLVETVATWVETARDVLEGGGGLPRVVEVFESRLENEYGRPLPVYVRNMLKMSSLGLVDYLKKTAVR